MRIYTPPTKTKLHTVRIQVVKGQWKTKENASMRFTGATPEYVIAILKKAIPWGIYHRFWKDKYDPFEKIITQMQVREFIGSKVINKSKSVSFYGFSASHTVQIITDYIKYKNDILSNKSEESV
jgi:hypothetical protein